MDETKHSDFLRGQIYYINQPSHSVPTGSEMWADRYGVIVSNDVNNKYSNTVEVVYLTTSPEKIRKNKNKSMPTHVMVKSANKNAIALCEQTHSVDKSRIGDYIGTITSAETKMINQALLISFGISNTEHPTHIFQKWEHCIAKYGLEQTFHANSISEEDDNTIEMLCKERDNYKSLYNLMCLQLEKLKTAVNRI